MASACLAALFAAALLLLTPCLPALAAQDAAYTHISPDGNRLTRLKGTINSSAPIEIMLGGTPAWVLGLEGLWVVVLEDGSVEAFAVMPNGEVKKASVATQGIRPDAPPALIKKDGRLTLISTGLSSPILLGSGELFGLYPGGVKSGDEEMELAVLPDTRLLYDGEDRVLVLAVPATTYSHGVLGDDQEAKAINIIRANGTPHVVSRMAVLKQRVIEGTSAIWSDIDADGHRDVIFTASDTEDGARIMVYNRRGDLLARSQSVGQGFRWRHQIAAGPFGPHGEMEIVDVITPHRGGTVEFLRQDGDRLIQVATRSGYSSHVIGSRNLDMAAAGDFDSDGLLEVLVPHQDRRSIGAVSHAANGIVEKWVLGAGGGITTNIAVAGHKGKAAIAFGTADKRLMVWLSK